MTKRIDPDAKITYGVRIPYSLSQEIQALFDKSHLKIKCRFYEMLLIKGIAKYKEDENASST